MPRDGSGVYSRPVGTDAVTDTTIESTKYNVNVADVEQDLNQPRPIVAGGTGGSSATQALFNLSGETAANVVPNWDTEIWTPGSFYASATATGIAPVAGHAFAGICYINEPLANPPTNQNLVLEATDLTVPANPVKYIRVMTAGVWGAWTQVNAALTVKKNYLINGAMMISQENGAIAVTNNGFPVDQFGITTSNTGTMTGQQIAAATPGNSPNRLRVTATVADAAVGAGDWAGISQIIEGACMAELRAGTATAKTVTFRFGVKAPAGTYCLSLRNGPRNRTYMAEYTIAAGEANTDVLRTITLQLDTTGPWTTDNNASLQVLWTLMAGTSYQGTINVWQGGNLFGTANQFNFMGTAGNVFELFDVGMYEGTIAPPYLAPDFTTALEACQRYWRVNTWSANGSTGIAANCGGRAVFSSSMRAAPAVTIVGNPNTGAGATTIDLINFLGFRFYASVAANTAYEVNASVYIDARL